MSDAAARRPLRSLGWTRLGVIIWTSLASSIYFSLGIVSGHALGLTPLVYLAAGLFFALTALTYLEGAALHPERAGSTVFARYAFNELVSFIAGAAVLLDYVILIAICALTATDYLATFVPATRPRRPAGGRSRSRSSPTSRCRQRLRDPRRCGACGASRRSSSSTS